jgi:vitamin B12 transporter
MRRMLLASLALVPTLAQAQSTDILLPDQVITATRIPTLIEKIPAGVTVIDRQAIETKGFSTLPEALNAVPGLHVVQSGPAGGNASVFIRGTNSNHVLVLRDGIPVNDPSDPGGLFNFGVDGLSDIERIEVVRGPMAGLYGSGAIGGVINIITKHGKGAPQFNVDVGFGLPRSQRLAAGVSGSEGMFDYAIHADDRDDAGFDAIPQRMRVYTGLRNFYRSRGGSIELGVTPVEGTRAFVAFRARTSSFALDDLGFPAYDARNYRGNDDTIAGRAGVTSRLFEDRLETRLTVSRSVNDRRYIQPLEAADPNNTSSDSRYHGVRDMLSWENTFHLPDAGPTAESAILFGAQHVNESSRSNLSLTSFGFPYSNKVAASANSDAGHIGLQSTLAQRLTLTADVRSDEGRYGGGAITWRTGAVLAVPEAWSRLKASYGTAFRAPALYDLFGVDSSGYTGNPNLKPERSQGWEAGFAVDIPALGRKDAATIDITFFDNRINNLIQTVYNSSFTAATTQNVARASTSGYEASLTLRPAPWLEAVSTYTLTNTRNRTTGAVLLRRPRESASLSLRATPIESLTIAPELVYSGPFQDFIYADSGFPTGTGRAKAGSIVNLSVSYTITPKLTAYIDGRNLTGSRFEPASGFQTPGASVLAGLRAKF